MSMQILSFSYLKILIFGRLQNVTKSKLSLIMQIASNSNDEICKQHCYVALFVFAFPLFVSLCSKPNVLYCSQFDVNKRL